MFQKFFFIINSFLLKIYLGDDILCEHLLENRDKPWPRIETINSKKYIITQYPSLQDFKNKKYYIKEKKCFSKKELPDLYFLKVDENFGKSGLNNCQYYNYPFSKNDEFEIESEKLKSAKIVNFNNNNYLEINTRNSELFFSQINKLTEKNSDYNLKNKFDCIKTILGDKLIEIDNNGQKNNFVEFKQKILYNKFQKILNLDQIIEKAQESEENFNKFFDEIITQLLKFQDLNILFFRRYLTYLFFENNKIIPFGISDQPLPFIDISAKDIFIKIFLHLLYFEKNYKAKVIGEFNTLTKLYDFFFFFNKIPKKIKIKKYFL